MPKRPVSCIPKLGLHRIFIWVFVTAGVQNSILIVGILRDYDLAVDIRNEILVDQVMKLYVDGVLVRLVICRSTGVQLFGNVLGSFPQVLIPISGSQTVTDSTGNHIRTSGLSVFANNSRPASHELSIAPAKFKHVGEVSVIFASNSPSELRYL